MKKNTFKKLIATILCVMMLGTLVLTSCQDNDDEDETDAEYRTPYSLVMTLVSEKPVSAETEKLIEDAFNAITESKYKTRVDLRYYTADEYFESLKQTIENIQMGDIVEGGDSSNGSETTAAEEETIINEEYGYSEFKYPEVKQNQLDIVYISGSAMYKYLIDNDCLSKLDTELTTTSKVLNDYIFPEYLNAVKVGQATYAIPNNNVAGDYTYMLVNKELAEKYQYTSAMKSWSTLTGATDFIEDVANYETGVLPIYGNPTPINCHNWSYELTETNGLISYKLVPSKFSIFGCTIQKEVTAETILSIGKTLTASYGTQLTTIQGFKDKNYVSETLADGQKFGVGFIKGNEKDVKDYRDDYEVIVLETPKMTADSIFENMFGVFSNFTEDSARIKRCMEVITRLNTDAELRNILQYGIEGTHYTIDDKTGVLTRLNDDYMMDVSKTGNIFMAHAEEGVDPADLEYMKQQTIDACIYPSINVLLGEDEVDFEIIKQTNAVSEKYEKKLAACKSVEEIQAVISEYRADNEIYNLNASWLTESGEKTSPYVVYYNWLKSMGLVTDED